MKDSLKTLVENLPEVYQPIFGHTELPYDTSRTCDDRLIEISNIYKLLEKNLGRPLKVLDLGCAQGFFSLSLAQLGAKVQGIDFLDKNIAVCNALADENKNLFVKFNEGRIEDILSKLQENEYDLVLGLSVFHHLVYAHGLEVIQEMLSGLSEKIKVGIFELALQEEPLYWGNAQANPPIELLNGFSFTHEIKKYPTHLSHINRPLIVGSDRYWILDNYIGKFDTYLTDSHSLANGVHNGTRKYYLNNNEILKKYKLNNKKIYEDNIREYQTEVKTLNLLSKEEYFPKLISHGKDNEEAWIIRENIEGMLLLDKITNKEEYNSDTIINDILEQCIRLEELGLYHNDLRTWNVLIDKKGNAKLIDFGSISSSPNDCIFPDNIFLVFYTLIKEIIESSVIKPALIRNIDYNFDLLPEPYRSGFIKLFVLEHNSLSFKKLLNHINTADTHKTILPEGFRVLKDSIQQTSSLVRDMQDKISKLKEDVAISEAKVNEEQIKAHEIQTNANNDKVRANEVQTQARQAEILAHEAEVRAHEAEVKLNEVWHHYHTIENSNSWKMTKPLRVSGKGARWFLIGIKHWVTFSPTSRPRRVVKKSLIHSKTYINKHPKLKMKLLHTLNRFPTIKERLKKVGGVATPTQIEAMHTQVDTALSCFVLQYPMIGLSTALHLSG